MVTLTWRWCHTDAGDSRLVALAWQSVLWRNGDIYVVIVAKLKQKIQKIIINSHHGFKIPLLLPFYCLKNNWTSVHSSFWFFLFFFSFFPFPSVSFSFFFSFTFLFFHQTMAVHFGYKFKIWWRKRVSKNLRLLLFSANAHLYEQEGHSVNFMKRQTRKQISLCNQYHTTSPLPNKWISALRGSSYWPELLQ